MLPLRHFDARAPAATTKKTEALLHHHPHRAMVAAENLLQDKGFLDPRHEHTRSQEIVDSPAYIPAPGPAPIAPPGILVALVGIEIPEGIHQSAR